MAEYDSFHYLMHKPAEEIPVNWVSGGKPLSFNELYSPRPLNENGTDFRLVHKGERSYWRTRDRVVYEITESRKHGVIVVTCRNPEIEDQYLEGAVYRTIFLDIAKLYNELLFKTRGKKGITDPRGAVRNKSELKAIFKSDAKGDLHEQHANKIRETLICEDEVIPHGEYGGY